MMTTETATNQLHSASILSKDQLRKLTRIQGRATAYEITVTRKDGEVIRICYSAQHSFRGLRMVLSERFTALHAIGVAIDGPFVTRGKGINRSLEFADGSIIKFSGRTQREAIIEGEHSLLVRFSEVA